MTAARALLLAVLAIGVLAADASAAISQPRQPASGPGGSDYPHANVRVSAGGTGADAWFVIEPIAPRPKTAPLAVITHGYYEFSGLSMMEALVRHTARTGSVVIYPRWQTDAVTPCPGPFDIEPCMRSEVAGLKGALAFLRAPGRVQPQLDRTSYFGFSFGGIITTNLVNRYRQLGVPKPRAVFLDDPHDGGFTGDDEPALDDDLGGIPASTLFVCHSGADGVMNDPSRLKSGARKANGSCNAVFPKLRTIPARNKDLVLTSTDRHGGRTLSSAHGVCAGRPADANAYDWGFCWKQWDALRTCALERRDCRTALGNTPEHRYLGTWSDGVPILGLRIQDTAPIRATPTPKRQPRP